VLRAGKALLVLDAPALERRGCHSHID